MTKSLLTILFILNYALGITQNSEPISQRQYELLDSLFLNYSDQPGIAIAVVRKNKTLIKKGYGLASLEYDIPVTNQTIFEASAFAKQITAACIFTLEKEGKLNLSDPIQKFFPDFPTYSKGSLTVQNLLYQTSGIRSYPAILYSQNRRLDERLSNQEIQKLITKQKNLNIIPGSKNEFSLSNYIILANIVEKVSEKSLADYAKEKFFIPLNMNHTFFQVDPNELVKNKALAYQPDGNKVLLDNYYYTYAIGDGGLYSNLDDMIKWMKNLNTGDVGGQELISKLITPGKSNSGEKTNYAGGLFFQNHYDIEDLPTVRHSGEWAGFRSLYYKFLNQDVSFIILSNNANTNVWALLDQLTPIYLEEEIDQAVAKSSSSFNEPKIVSLSNKDKQRFSGHFYNLENGNVRSVEFRNDTLLYKRTPTSPGTKLLPINKSELIFQVAPQIKLSFDSDNYETMILTINDEDPQYFQRYERKSYTNEELKQYENKYYNEDCDVVYQIVVNDQNLIVMVRDEELVVLNSMAIDIFRDEHFGYIKFIRDKDGLIDSFIRQDNTFTDLKFTRI